MLIGISLYVYFIYNNILMYVRADFSITAKLNLTPYNYRTTKCVSATGWVLIAKPLYWLINELKAIGGRSHEHLPWIYFTHICKAEYCMHTYAPIQRKSPPTQLIYFTACCIAVADIVLHILAGPGIIKMK